MTQGSLIIFDKFYSDLVKGEHAFDKHTFKAALTTIMPEKDAVIVSKVDLAEVASGGSYASGGKTVTVDVSIASGKAVVDVVNDISWPQHVNNPNDAICLIFYNDTHPNKNAIGFCDITEDAGLTPVNMLVSNLKIKIHASGLFDAGAAE